MNLKAYFPILSWAKQYKRTDFSGDLSAGLIVGVMLIPQGMAYSMLAGLPPIYGLYASTIPLIIYAILGTSRQLAVGPVAMVALLIASGVGTLADQGSSEYLSYAILLALMVGLIQAGMGLFRLGFLVNFLSHPVIAGFTSAAAIIIGLSQLKHLLGINLEHSKLTALIPEVLNRYGETDLLTLGIGIGAILLLVLLKKNARKIPGPLVVVVVSMVLVYFLGWSEEGVKIVRDIPGGFPQIIIPSLSGETMLALLPIALTISFVGFMESIAVAKAIQAKHKNYTLDANQELIGLGFANIGGAFFQSFPVTGGFSRTAVNDQAGARTGLASIISAFLIILTLLFLTKYFYYLPNAVLAAIIMVAVFGLIDFREAYHLWYHDKKDFAVFMVTALATLVLGIEEGILVGVLISLAILIYRASYPHIALLGRVPGSKEFRNVNRFENLEGFKEILILRFDAELFFANASALRDFILSRLKKNPSIKYVVIECSAVSNIDSSGIHMLQDLIHDLRMRDKQIYFSDVKGPVRDILSQNGILDADHPSKHFINTHEAVQAILFGKENQFTSYVSQSLRK